MKMTTYFTTSTKKTVLTIPQINKKTVRALHGQAAYEVE